MRGVTYAGHASTAAPSKKDRQVRVPCLVDGRYSVAAKLPQWLGGTIDSRYFESCTSSELLVAR